MKLMSYLQLLYEGRIEKIPGIDWSAIVASARLNWLQLKKLTDEENIKEKLKLKIIEHVEKSSLEELKVTVAELKTKLSDLTKVISNAVIVSTQSADEVGQKVLSKLKKRKTKKVPN